MHYLKESLQNSFSLIVSLDANKNMREGRLWRSFNEIRIITTSYLFTNKDSPTTLYNGRYQINTI